MRNTHRNRPRNLLRAIIIHALSEIGKKKPETASVIYQTAFSPINHDQAKFGKEEDLVKGILQEFGEESEKEAINRASIIKPKTKKIKRRKATPKPKPPGQIKNDEILMDVVSAAGPQDREGNQPPNPNRYWPTSDAEWAYEFAPRMASALTRATNLGIERISNEMQQISGEVDIKLIENIKSIQEIRAEIFESQQSIQMRLDVLWWSKAKYSPSLMRGYGSFNGASALFLMAFDLTQIVPPLCPTSIVHVLSETVIELLRSETTLEEQSIKQYLNDLHEEVGLFEQLVAKKTTNSGLQPLLEYALEILGGNQFDEKEFKVRTGVDPSLTITPADFAIWIFRDLQSRRIIEELT